MKSFKMHMLKNHSNTENRYDSAKVTLAKNNTANITSANNDSADVTLAENDTTHPTPDHDTTINYTSNTTIYQNTMNKIEQICIHFQKGTCKYDEQCRKKHLPKIIVNCQLCDAKNMTLGQLNFHMINIHDPDMPFSCDQCNF